MNNMKAKTSTFTFAMLLAAFSALGPFTFDMYLPSFPQIMKDFDTSASAIQMSLTATLLGVGIGQIFMGPISDVHGRKKPLGYAMIAYALSSFGCAFAPNIAVFIGCVLPKDFPQPPEWSFHGRLFVICIAEWN